MSMAGERVLVNAGQGGVVQVTMNRDSVRNAFDEVMIAGLAEVFDRLGRDRSVRVIVLRGSGRHFSAGADLDWMRRMAQCAEAENREDALGLARMLRVVYACPKPVVARIQGAAMGGGVGLAAACDIAVAAADARFALTEVRLGLIPSVISPYVVRAIGVRACRRFFLTGETVDAPEALRLGLVHRVVPAPALDEAVDEIVSCLLSAGPGALAAAKDLIGAVSDRPLDDDLLEDTARRIAAVRNSAEGREGVGAFLEKRVPSWIAGAG